MPRRIQPRDGPLFIVLRREFFEAFRNNTKTQEWRLYGARWNEESCYVGRRVVLSLGYTRTRLAGVVVSFKRRRASQAAASIYGEGAMCAVIGIELDPAG